MVLDTQSEVDSPVGWKWYIRRETFHSMPANNSNLLAFTTAPVCAQILSLSLTLSCTYFKGADRTVRDVEAIDRPGNKGARGSVGGNLLEFRGAEGCVGLTIRSHQFGCSGPYTHVCDGICRAGRSKGGKSARCKGVDSTIRIDWRCMPNKGHP